jgi:hypothetical protein
LVQNKWISQISPIQTLEELNEYVVLWESVNMISRRDDAEDEIKWKWTPDGQYKAPIGFNSWGDARNRHLLLFGKQKPS